MDHALVSGMERKEILKVKQEQISTPIKEAIHKYGNHPELLFMIIFRAIELLKELIKLPVSYTHLKRLASRFFAVSGVLEYSLTISPISFLSLIHI